MAGYVDSEARAEDNFSSAWTLVIVGVVGLVLMILVSLLNQLLLLLKVNFHFLFSASVPYYLNWLARKLGGPAGVTPLKVIAVIVTLVIYFAYVACWLFSARRKDYLKTALLLYCADTVLLVIFACALLNNPFNCLLELLTHLLVVAVLYTAHRAAQQLSRMPKKKKSAPTPPAEDGQPAETY
jgi:hypothetical protein